jgi:hypothetical protein
VDLPEPLSSTAAVANSRFTMSVPALSISDRPVAHCVFCVCSRYDVNLFTVTAPSNIHHFAFLCSNTLDPYLLYLAVHA